MYVKRVIGLLSVITIIVVLALFLLLGQGGKGSPQQEQEPDFSFLLNLPAGEVNNTTGTTAKTDICGDGVCSASVRESCANCAADCKCPPGKSCNLSSKDVDETGCAEIEYSCGDGACEAPMENCNNCYIDCECNFFNEVCAPSSTVANSRGCVMKGGTKCGNGVCEPGEDCVTCTFDCSCKPADRCVMVSGEMKCVAKGCGDTVCLAGKEDCETCTFDCSCKPGWTCDPDSSDSDSLGCLNLDTCGNHKCDSGEDCRNCQADCACQNNQTCRIVVGGRSYCRESNACGDGFCDFDPFTKSGESCKTCPKDCRCANDKVCTPTAVGSDVAGCVVPSAICGDHNCDENENCETCPTDCWCSVREFCNPDSEKADEWGCANQCGDGVCQAGEDCKYCNVDCPCGSKEYCDPGSPVAASDGCIRIAA